MKQREAGSWVITGSFLFVLFTLIATGIGPLGSRPQRADAPDDIARHGPDAQFLQYLEYRVELENSSNCQ
jgi:hypothetical protein